MLEHVSRHQTQTVIHLTAPVPSRTSLRPSDCCTASFSGAPVFSELLSDSFSGCSQVSTVFVLVRGVSSCTKQTMQRDIFEEHIHEVGRFVNAYGRGLNDVCSNVAR